jgi:[acyl-carrier-protein] S-malonyltransferase
MSPKTIAMIFPGQGSQAVGMGKALADAYPVAKAIFEEADQVLGRPISKLCFEGPEEELKQTVNTQPALYVSSAAALAVLRQ